MFSPKVLDSIVVLVLLVIALVFYAFMSTKAAELDSIQGHHYQRH